MNEDQYLSHFPNTHSPCHRGLIDFIHHIHFQKVIARAQGSQLRHSPLLGLGTHLPRVGAFHASTLFGNIHVFIKSEAVFHRPASASFQYIAYLLFAHPYLAG